jgi:hypothetical protein
MLWVCVCVALLIQHAKCMRQVILSCDLSGFTIFFFPHYVLNSTIFLVNVVCNVSMCFDVLYRFYLKYFSF